MRPAIPALPGQCGQAPQLVSAVKANGRGESFQPESSGFSLLAPATYCLAPLLPYPPPSQPRVQTSPQFLANILQAWNLFTAWQG